MAEEKFRIEKGMDVVDKDEKPLGRLENIYSEGETRRSRFVNVSGRLLPVEAIDDVQQGRVKLAIPQDRFRSFPEHTATQMPTEDHQRKAYDSIGMQGPG